MPRSYVIYAIKQTVYTFWETLDSSQLCEAISVRFPIFLSLILAISFASGSARAVNAEQGRSRLLELFIWKTSEELKLPTDVETKYGEIIRQLNERRRTNGERMEKAIARLDELTKASPQTENTPALAKVDSKAVAKALDEYKKAIAELQKLQNDEISQLKAILPPEKLARYLVVKNEMTEKLKTFLSKPNEGTPVTKDGKPLEAPKVIEEK